MGLTFFPAVQDYFVLVPNEYYEPSLLKEQVLEPCLAGAAGTEREAAFCRHFVYPDAEGFPTGWADYAERPGGGGGQVNVLFGPV